MKYSMTCTCGHKMSVDAPDKETAAQMLQDMMTQDELDKHWEDAHQGDENKPTLEQSHAMIEQTVGEDADQTAAA